ncbi:MAG TPA: ABC transporter permease, partial [Nitrospiraceae bacterium]|nr:ABC transporter permease [Nitrospiraceae bacterium]
MKAIRRFLKRLTASATTQHDEERLREELEAHVAMQTAENVLAGVPPEEARRQALLKCGSRESVRASYRDEQGLPTLDDFVQDVRYTLRQLRKAPLFTLVATVSLALGVGANAAVFSVTERVLLRPLPVSDPHELVYITDERILTQASPRFSYPFYTILRDNNILDGVAARSAIGLTATVNGQHVRVSAELVSGSYFSMLGAGTHIGRPLSLEDDQAAGAHPVAVISYSFWRRAFDADSSVIGRAVQLNAQTFTIVGVASKGFTGTDVAYSVDMWVPMVMQRAVGLDLLADGRSNWLEIIGRLNSSTTRERAAEQLTAHFQRRRSELPPQVATTRILLVPGDQGNSPVRRELGPALALLMALTGLALGLACINVASLVAVRSAAREKEIAIRLALGAWRSRLTRQLLTEGLVLAAVGGFAGLLIAPWAARLIVVSQSRGLDIDTSLDGRVLLFGLVVSVFTGLIIALAPILASRNVGLAQVSQRSSFRPTAILRHVTAHDLIVTLQIGMALAMLISAALLVQSLRSFNSVNPGFRADSLLLVSLDPKAAGYDSNRIDGFWRAALEQVRQIPGVQSVSLARTVPLAPGRQRQPWLNPTSGEKVELDTNLVGPRYFRTLDIPLLRGREFGDEDGRTSRPVVIVNERLALLFWPDQDPIGKGVRLPGAKEGMAEVVGVARDVKYRDLRGDTDPMFYRPVLQTRSTDALVLHVRASGDLGALAGAIRLAIQNVDRRVPLFQVTTLEEQLNASFAQTRQAALLTGVFAVLALLLSGIGVYGVAALAVSRRTREIGIQMALGARARDIVRATGRRGITLVAAGLSLGLLGSLGFTQVAGTLLFGVTAADSATFA